MTRPENSRTDARAPHEIEAGLREKLRRNAIDAAHFFGLAALYEERGKRQQAAECLEIARRKDAVNPFAHKLHGKILFRRKMFNAAAAELRMARRYNPFDRETAEVLGRIEYERERYREALEATIDAFLLVEEDDRENGDRLKKRIRTLKTIQRITNADLTKLFRERRDKLQTDFDRLEWQREQFMRQELPEDAELRVGPAPAGGQLQLANRLRKLDLWSSLTDDQIFHLSRAARDEFHPKGTTIFTYGSTGADIYALEDGEIGIYRPTSYGTYPLGTLQPGSVFGEVNFISRAKRSGDAVAARDSHILRLEAAELELVIEQHPELGVRIYSMFWDGLAMKLRGANETLRSLFSEDTASENFLRLRSAEDGGENGEEGGGGNGGNPHTGASAISPAGASAGSASGASSGSTFDASIDVDSRKELLRQQGLSGDELATLAKFSTVRTFEDGEIIFREGDPGDEMHAILEGQVRISKGVGQGLETLALLDRGDFFGEMALLDGEPRSADARAEGDAGKNVKTVAFDDAVLREVLMMDPVAALDFMKLVCRLICERLREIDEKLTRWRILSGASSEDASSFVEGPTPRRRPGVSAAAGGPAAGKAGEP